jgi:hypothetical protein
MPEGCWLKEVRGPDGGRTSASLLMMVLLLLIPGEIR